MVSSAFAGSDTSNLNEGVLMSAYKTIDSMQEKIEKQLGLATKLMSVDERMGIASAYPGKSDYSGYYSTRGVRCQPNNQLAYKVVYVMA